MEKNQKKLTPEEIQQRLDTLDSWELEGSKKIHKSYTFKNFKQALAFTNKVGSVAEELQHHPDIYLTWGKVNIEIYTHRTDQLTEADFQLAERIDQID
ncbi:4a-hydroxytetrahydrobiopterin dehydratase [Atopococcus tabaci]|uniref:4a-hydroxytetrahydrobiopterin dehydratase n=1 Tax=Atopococcus tabaci TaxID=269774 RepID=UPI0004197370|nr:4a-hydroxytetrahydrobiopterin dehydratase [Atopococcus tabaci]